MSQLVLTFVSAWQLVVKRSLARWRLLLSVLVGVLLTSAIMAGTVIYFDALRVLALSHALSGHPASQLDILAVAETRPTSHQEYERVSTVSQRQIDLPLAWLLRDRISASKTATFYLATPGEEELAGKDDNRAYFAFAPRLQQYTTLLPGGRLPREGPLSSPGEPLKLEAILPVEAAKLLGVGVGDTLSVVPAWESGTPYARVVISGLFQRDDPDAEIWYLDDRVLKSGTTLTVNTAPFFISKNSFLGVLGPAFSDLKSTYAWLLDVDTDLLTPGNSSQARSDIELAQRRVGAVLDDYGLSARTLFSVLEEYDRRILFSKLPMFIILILIAVVVLYYVVILSSLLVDQRRGELALLRSRGASPGQILVVFVLEGATISLAAIVVAPLLAATIIRFLGYAPAFSDLSGNALLPVNISRGAYMMSALGGVLSFAALMVNAVQASRTEVTGLRQQASRPVRLPAFQRYYLDVLLLIISIVLFRQLSDQGSVVAADLFGEVAVDQMLLVIPGLMLVAAAMILLRLFPLAMDLSSRLLARWLPAGLVLGLWQMARNPAHYARLSLLLILTAGLGMFAASFAGTLELSFKDRVLYSAGSDIRVVGVKPKTYGFSRDVSERYEGRGAIDRASPVYRGRGLDPTKPEMGTFTVLAVNEDSFGEVASLRDDFSRKPLAGLLKSLHYIPSAGIQLDRSAVTIGVLLKLKRPYPDMEVNARIRDANDRYDSFRLGWLGDTDVFGNVKKADWLQLGTVFQRLDGELIPKAPLTLVALEFHVPTGRLLPGSILIDQITTGKIYREPEITVKTEIIEPFDDTEGWSVLRLTQEALTDELRQAEASSDGESGLAVFTWSGGEAGSRRGIIPGPPMSPLPVLASKSFVDDGGYRVGDEFLVSLEGNRVPVRLLDTVDFFPTLDPFRDRFLVADLSSLLWYANLDARGSEIQPNEMWLSPEPGDIDRASLVASLYRDPFESDLVHDRAKLLDEARVDPLAKAGWSVLLFIAFSAVLILSCIAFLVHAYTSFRSREVQFALVRTMGFSMRQLITLVLLEQALVIAAGMALGTWMGGRLSAVIMPFLGYNEQSGQVLPPLVIEVNWATLAITYAAMAFVFALITVGVIWFIRKISLQRILRMGEM